MTPAIKSYLLKLLKKEIQSCERSIELQKFLLPKAFYPETVRKSIARHEEQKREAKKIRSEIEKIKFPRKKQVKRKK